MRADRLLSIMLLLQVQRRITARELAKRLEVSERTIHRDMEALSVAGIPVVAERGTGGGWMLMEAYKTNLTGLNEAEIQALSFNKPSHILKDLGLRDASESAFIKLLAALPALSRHNAEYARQRIYIDTGGWKRSEENIAALPLLQEAIWQERKLCFTYQRNDDAPLVERLAHPLGLVAKGSTWYFVASVDESLRTYRVSRIQEVRVLDERCTRPPGFNLVEYWVQSSLQFQANLPRYTVTVRIEPNLLSWIRYTRGGRIQRQEPPDEQGWIQLTIHLETEEEACQYVMGFGDKIEVLEPLVLREKVIERAKCILAFYTVVPESTVHPIVLTGVLNIPYDVNNMD